jgi:hypothetical protein
MLNRGNHRRLCLSCTRVDCLCFRSLPTRHHTVLLGALSLGKQGKHRSSLAATARVSCLDLRVRIATLHKPVYFSHFTSNIR